MTRPLDHTGELASPSEPNSAAPLLLPASDERRAPTAILSSAKRAALIACLNGGSLHRRCGVWTAPSASVGDKLISGATVSRSRAGRHANAERAPWKCVRAAHRARKLVRQDSGD